MKILHAIDSTAPCGGGPVEVIRQSQPVLEHMGHQSEIVCLDQPDAPWLADLPIPTHALGPAWTRYRINSRLVPWLRAHASDHDCVIVHGLWRYISCAVWRALKVSDTPYFVYAHGMLDPVFRQVFPWKHWQKCLHWASIEHRVARDACAVLFTCREEARKAAESFRPYRATAGIAPCCIASPPPENREASEAFFKAWPESRGKRILLFLGRIHRKKGCDLLIEAFGQIANRDARLHLIMAGPPEPPQWVDQLKLRARALGIESRVTWTGMLTGDAKWAAFRVAEAFILPSYQENFGIAVVEALACGTPVLISKQVDIWSEIVEAGAGIAGEAGLSGTQELLEHWLSMPAEEREAMRRNAANCFRDRFRGEAAAMRLIDILTTGVAGRVKQKQPN